MTINLADNTPRVSYNVAQGVTQSSFTVSFEFFDDADLNVYVDGTLKTLTTDYTVTGGDGSTGSITMSVTGASGGSTVVVTRDIDLKRTTDFPASGAFQIGSLNTELDKLIAIAADINDEVGRSLRLTDYDASVSLVLPDVDGRKGKVLAFNATSGAVEAGPTIVDTQTVAAISADISTLADIEDGTDATDAIQDVAAIASDVSSVAAIDSNVTTVATNVSDINTVVTNITDIQNAEEHAQEAKDYATKVNGQVQEDGANSGNYSSKAWAVGGTGVTDASGSGSAKEWATDTTNTCDGTEYSAKEYAIGTQSGQSNGSAKQWAIGGGTGFDRDTAVSGGEYSAKYWANQAANSAQSQRDVYYGAFTTDAAAETYQTGTNSGTVDAGDIYFNSTSNRLRVYDGSNWNDAVVDTTGFATAGFSIAMSIAL